MDCVSYGLAQCVLRQLAWKNICSRARVGEKSSGLVQSSRLKTEWPEIQEVWHWGQQVSRFRYWMTLSSRGLDGRHSVGGEREQARKELGFSLGSRLIFPEKLQ